MNKFINKFIKKALMFLLVFDSNASNTLQRINRLRLPLNTISTNIRRLHNSNHNPFTHENLIEKWRTQFVAHQYAKHKLRLNYQRMSPSMYAVAKYALFFQNYFFKYRMAKEIFGYHRSNPNAFENTFKDWLGTQLMGYMQFKNFGSSFNFTINGKTFTYNPKGYNNQSYNTNDEEDDNYNKDYKYDKDDKKNNENYNQNNQSYKKDYEYKNTKKEYSSQNTQKTYSHNTHTPPKSVSDLEKDLVNKPNEFFCFSGKGNNLENFVQICELIKEKNYSVHDHDIRRILIKVMDSSSRDIMKKLHPDLNPGIDQTALQNFNSLRDYLK